MGKHFIFFFFISIEIKLFITLLFKSQMKEIKTLKVGEKGTGNCFLV